MPFGCATSAAGNASASRHAGSRVGYLRIYEACLQVTNSSVQKPTGVRVGTGSRVARNRKQVCVSHYELRRDTFVGDSRALMLPDHVIN